MKLTKPSEKCSASTMPCLIWPLIMTAVCEQLVEKLVYPTYVEVGIVINKGEKEELMANIYSFW